MRHRITLKTLQTAFILLLIIFKKLVTNDGFDKPKHVEHNLSIGYMFQNNFSYHRRSLFLLPHMTYHIERSQPNNRTQISLPTSSTMLHIYYTKFLHVSAIYPGHLQEDTSLVWWAVPAGPSSKAVPMRSFQHGICDLSLLPLRLSSGDWLPWVSGRVGGGTNSLPEG